MGGSGGSAISGGSPDTLRDLVRKAEGSITEAAFDGRLAETLGELLATYNGRDTASSGTLRRTEGCSLRRTGREFRPVVWRIGGQAYVC